MSSVPQPEQDSPGAVLQPAETRLWGFGLMELHDRYWASRGFQIVRPGGPAPDPDGPELFVLLDENLFVGFGVRHILRTMAWMQPKAIRVRLVETEHSPYRERVLSDDEGRFLRFERQYNAKELHSAQLWVTPKLKYAELWNRSASGKAGSRVLVDRIDKDDRIAKRIPGRIFQDDAAGSEAFRRWLLHAWASPNLVVQGIYQPSPGVWLHETCRVDPTVRIIGPVWLGAGHTIGSGETIVGPAIVPDAARMLTTPADIDWYTVTHSSWRLIPTLKRRPMRAISKRAFDIVVALMALAVTLPFYPIIIALILLEDGRPIFFTHRRQRYNGKTFPCIKFRSMRRDAEEIKAKLMAENLSDGPQFFMGEDNDPRILRVGRPMRKLKIDELPQFFNVLVGHMSIVGPRPSPDRENQYCPAWREARLSVRPGITGLWQVKSEREPQTDFQEWIRYDLEYVQNNTWRLDLWIMLETAKKILFRS